ncbi:MAG TPA: hypothetical protein VLX92_21305 [Kofleriaceae bacterium]|nr:hypothetical protein [Kofleriaceae bacterium]
MKRWFIFSLVFVFVLVILLLIATRGIWRGDGEDGNCLRSPPAWRIG